MSGVAEPVFVVEPARGWTSLELGSLWEYRELLYFLVWRDLKVRYKQTAVGVVWAILQPFLTMVVFSIFLGYLAGVPSAGVPYPLFVFTALLPWQLFAYSLTASGNSLVMNAHLVTKVFFPRLLVPLAATVVAAAELGCSLLVLLAMMVYYRVVPGPAVFILPFLVLLTILTALAVGLCLGTLSVQYRDVHIAIPFLTQLWLFVTPVAYPMSLVPERWQPLYALNPMVGVVEGFRWALLGHAPPPRLSLLLAIGVTTLLLASGLAYFKRMEHSFADVI